MRHAHAIGLKSGNKGTKNGRAMVNEEDVKHIRKLRLNGETYPSIASKFGISNVQASYIANRKSWKHVL